jgi:hypothetical protein
MAIIQVQGQRSGRPYSINIAGSTPTPEEQARINQFVSQKEAEFESFFAERFAAPQVEAPVEEAPPEDDGTAIGRGVSRGLQTVRSLLGTAVEETGRGLGFEGVQEFGRGMETAAEEELRRLQEIRARTGLYDVEGVGSALTYGGETLGEQVPILGTTLAGAGAGFALAGPPGALVGGALASLPLLFGGNVQRQEEQVAAGELDKVSVERALLTAIPQAALEGIAGRILALAPLRPGVGSIWARTAKGGALGTAAEVPTEITQQVLERAQAGLPIDDDEAIREYIEAGVAAAIVGAPVGGIGGAIQTDARQTELDQDYKELALEGSRRFRFAEETERQIEADRQKAMAQAGIDPEAPLGPQETLALPAPERPLGLPSPESVDVAPETAVTDVEFENRSFDRAQYERVLQQIKADITSDKPINVAAIQQRVKADIPGIKVSQVKDILTELQARGFIAENPIPKKQKYIPMGALAPEVKTPDVSYRRQIDTATDFIKADQSRIERLNYDLQSAEAYGRDLDGNRVTPNQISAEIARVEQRIADNQSRIDSAQQRLQTLGQDMHVPRIERVGVPSGLKAVPVPEATADALRPRFEAQQQSIRGYKEQLGSIKKQIVKLNEQAKKRRLSSNELDRMQKLQQAQGEISTRLGEAQANLKTPEKILQEAKGEQFREQERQREIERKLAAAQARAAADQVQAQENQGVSPTSERFNAKQDAVFERLKKRLSGLGLKGVKLERGQKIEGAEGAYDPVTRVLTLAMGLYNPNLTEQQLFEAISEVMDHEIIHALKALGALTPKEFSMLEKAAGNTRYVKRTNEGNIKRSYTYLDRAKKLYPDLNETQQKEEAVAEMFRDYVAGRLKVGGAPRAFLEKIKKFFKALIGANVDEGFTSVQDIFNNITTGRIGERIAPAATPAPAPVAAAAPSPAPAPVAAPAPAAAAAAPVRAPVSPEPAPAAQPSPPQQLTGMITAEEYAALSAEDKERYRRRLAVGFIAGVEPTNELVFAPSEQLLRSRVPVTEEDAVPLQDIRMPVNPNLPNDQVRDQIQRLTNQNRPLVRRLISRIDQRFGTRSGDNVKDLSKVTQKAKRPSILATKPWHDVSHIRDSYRFKTVIDDFRDVPAIFDELLGQGIQLVKIDTAKLFRPKEWGWRIISFDMRMPNGQLVEWYLPLKELEAEKKARGHLIFEEWRNKTEQELHAQREEYFDAMDRSYRGYDEAFQAALDRVGLSRQEAEASWSNAESSISEAARNARRSSGVGTSPTARSATDLMAPSMVRTALEPSDLKMMAREVPSSTSAKASAIVSTSDDYMPDAPAEERPLFSRIPRSQFVASLAQFIRDNPDGFTVRPRTLEPVSGGYVVAPLKEAEIIVGESLPEEVLIGYIEDNKDISRAIRQPVYLGGWFDSQSSQYFLDNTLILPNLEDALYIAEAADQLAIFDLNNFQEIRTNEGIQRLRQTGAYRNYTADGYKRGLEEVGRRFAEARDSRRARLQRQLVGEVKRPLQSRLVLPLSQEERAASIIDYLNPNTGQPLFKKKAGSETLVSFANKLLELRGVRPYDVINSQEDRDRVANIMAAEAEAALLSSSDAIGWYGDILNLAKQILYPAYPEISRTRPDGSSNPLYDPAAEHAFDYATAVTSNGMAVIDNYKFAAQQYDAWKSSTDGKFPVEGKGDQGKSMLAAFQFWNNLVDLGYDSNAISEMLSQQMPRSELSNILKEAFGVSRVKDLPVKIDTKEEADTVVSVAYVIGPKIGNGFYQNLRGNFDPLTMDRWWMRFFNRITGNPLVVYSEENLGKTFEKVWDYVRNPNNLTPMEREILRRAQENLNMISMEKSDIALLAAEMEKVWNKDFFNKAYNDKLRDLLAEGMDFEVKGGSVRGPDAERAKKIARDARPEKPAMAKAVTTLVKKTKPSLEEAPRNAKDRTAMRATTNMARQILRDRLGVDISNADFQALMWYAEKRIFEAGGVKKGRGEDNDYADGAIAILKSKGVSDEQIENTLPETERGRIRSVESDLRREQEAGGSVGELARGPQEGDFFAPRRLSIVPVDETIQANMTPEEVMEIEAPFVGVEIDPELPRQMYSRVPVAQAYMPVRAPRDMADGSPNPIYGSIMEGGRKLPVVLPKGSHITYDNGIEAGNGLFHIQQRKHDLELFQNSKYQRVENAIYDLMRRWQTQGYEDGNDVISYPSGGNLALEWRENVAFGAPPLTLVLERGSDVRGAPVKDAYYVKTFYPVLEKKDRLTQQQRGRSLINSDRADSRRRFSRLLSTTAPTQGTPQFGPSDLETVMQNLRYAGVQEKVANIFKKLGKPFKLDEQAIEDGTQWVFNKLQDNFVSVGKMYDALRKQGANIPRDMDAYFQELLMHGVAGAKKDRFKTKEFTPVVEAVARVNVTENDSNALKRVSKYYDEILKKTGNKSHALANAYLYALHAVERNQRISEMSKGQINNGSGMSNQEAQNIISFVNSMDAQRRDAMRNIASAVQNMISGTNDTYIDGGLIPDYKDGVDVDDATKEAFTKYKNYVPLRGFTDPESELDVSAGGMSTTDRFGSLGKPNKTALGRISYAGDILANVAVQRENAIDKAEKNKVGVAFLNLLESNVDTDAYAEVLERHPLRRVMRNGTITVMPDREFNNPNMLTLAVRRGGEEVLIRFKDPRLATAFKGTSTQQMGAIMGGLHKITRFYANLLTSWNPAFLLSNLPRDIETALFNAQQYNMEGSSKDILKGVAPSMRAILRVLNNKPGADPYWANRYQQFYDNGGQNVLNQMGDVINNSKDIKDTISKIIAADEAGNRTLMNTLWNGTKKGAGSLVNYVEAVNTAVENSTRLAFFDAVVRNLESQGVPTERALREAAAAARQLTTNFAKGGELKGSLNTLYLFFNASLQGSMAMFNSLVNNSKARKLMAGVVIAGFMQDMINGLISGDEDDDGIKDYDNLSDYKLAHSIVLPDLNGDGTFVTIPLAYGINMFYNFGRVMGNLARSAMGDQGTYTAEEAASSTMGTVAETFNPFGGNNFWTFLSPTQLDMPIELMTNQNFMDQPIYKELSPFEQYKSRSGMYWSTTSPSAIWISKFLNDTIGRGTDIIPGERLGVRMDIQPDVIEHVIDFMLGGAGRFVIQMGEAGTTYAPAAIMGQFEEDMVRRTPIVNKFITAVTERDRSGDFYEKRDDVLAVYAELKDAIDNGDAERVAAVRSGYSEYLPLIQPIRSINSEIRKLNQMKRTVLKNPALSEERKRELKDKIDERIAAFVARGNQLMINL